MISHRSWNFKRLYALLPAHVQDLAMKNFLLWQQNPWHPSLDFKPHEPPDWSVRIGRSHRAVGAWEGDTIVWHWIGSHEAYNKLF